jgi:phage host-nuclease inhibitor protein Gam
MIIIINVEVKNLEEVLNQFIQAMTRKIDDLERELKSLIKEEALKVKTEQKVDLAELKIELKSEIARLMEKIEQYRGENKDHFKRVENELEHHDLILQIFSSKAKGVKH